jgi:biopolymer transport protein ExbD
MNMAASHRNDDFMSDINMTPLVDVMLVLLIVMMVTASFAVSKSMQLTLPKAATGMSESAPKTLAITALGEWYIDGKRTSEDELARTIAQLQQNTTDVHVIVAADAQARHQELVRAMDFLRSRNVARLSIGVARSEP